jgi:hypothetical protein
MVPAARLAMRTIVAAVFSTCLGCTTSDSKPAELPFTVADSAAMVRTSRGLTNIMLTDFVDSCSVADERMHPNAQTFTFLLSDFDADGPPSGPGTYQMYTLEALPMTGLAGECGIIADDATCRIALGPRCTSGSVTLTRVDAQGYAGTYDVVLDNGDHLAGAFDSPSCPDVSEAGFGVCQ